MGHRTPTVLVIALLSLAASCSDHRSPTAPTAVQSAASPTPPASPTTPVTMVQPAVTSITPSTGSTLGESWGVITGREFAPSATVTLGGATTRPWVENSTTIRFWVTTAHAPGAVDVVVTNPGGLSSTLSDGFTFAPPTSFDFNGDWLAHAGTDYDTEMRFRIGNNALVSLSCGGVPVVLTDQGDVGAGELSLNDAAGVTMTGRMVSPSNAAGTINVPGCAKGRWWADKSRD